MQKAENVSKGDGIDFDDHFSGEPEILSERLQFLVLFSMWRHFIFKGINEVLLEAVGQFNHHPWECA